MSLHPDFLAFLDARIQDDLEAAERRHGEAAGGSDQQARGLLMLREVAADLHAGRAPDPMSLRMLTLAYDRHPDFRREWSPWAG